MGGWSERNIPDQHGRTVVITGANIGLGLRSAVVLAGRGARVLLACRSPERGEAALAEVRAAATGPAPALVRLELGDLASVATAAGEIDAAVDSVDVLMNNAGVMAVPRRTLTKDGFEQQFGVNHLGHFALTLRLLPALLRAEAPRVVALGSLAHLRGRIELDDLQAERRYDRWTAYDQSKLANVMFALELEKRSKLAGLPLMGLAAHPGLARTNLFAAGPRSGGFNPVNVAMDLGVKIAGQSSRAGALGQLRAATDPAVRGGEYFGPTALFGSRGRPVHAPVSRRATDDVVSAALWSASEALVGLRFDEAVGAAGVA